MWPPTPGAVLLALLLYPVALLLRVIDFGRRQWYARRPRQFDWLAMEGVTQRLRELCGTCAGSVQCAYERCGDPRQHHPLGENGQFTEAMTAAVWFRIRPSFVPKDLFLKQLHDQMLVERERFRGPYWQLGCDELGRLCLQLTRAAVDNHEPSRRKRAKAVVFRMQDSSRLGATADSEELE